MEHAVSRVSSNAALVSRLAARRDLCAGRTRPPSFAELFGSKSARLFDYGLDALFMLMSDPACRFLHATRRRRIEACRSRVDRRFDSDARGFVPGAHGDHGTLAFMVLKIVALVKRQISA